MALHDDVADILARRTIANLDDLNDTDLERAVGDAIASASPSLQEAYATAMRVRRAEARAVAILEKFERANGRVAPKPAPKPAPVERDEIRGSTFERPRQDPPKKPDEPLMIEKKD